VAAQRSTSKSHVAGGNGVDRKNAENPKNAFRWHKGRKKKVVTGQYSTVRLRPQKIWRSTIASIINKYILNNTV